MVPVLIMFNNFFHDLAAAMLFCAMLGLFAVSKEMRAAISAQHAASLRRLEKLFFKAAGWSLFFIIVLGAVRAFNYRTFEWYAAVERGQVAALVVKHILFFFIVAAGFFCIWKRRCLR